MDWFLQELMKSVEYQREIVVYHCMDLLDLMDELQNMQFINKVCAGDARTFLRNERILQHACDNIERHLRIFEEHFDHTAYGRCQCYRLRRDLAIFKQKTMEVAVHGSSAGIIGAEKFMESYNKYHKSPCQDLRTLNAKHRCANCAIDDCTLEQDGVFFKRKCSSPRHPRGSLELHLKDKTYFYFLQTNRFFCIVKTLSELEGEPQPGTSLEGEPQPGTSLEGEPQPGTSLEGEPQPGTSLEGEPQPGTSLEGEPQPGTSLEGEPQPGTSLEGEPQPGTSLEGEPQPGTSLEGEPQPGTSLEGEPQPGTSLEGEPQPGTSLEAPLPLEPDRRNLVNMIEENEPLLTSQLLETAGRTYTSADIRGLKETVRVKPVASQAARERQEKHERVESWLGLQGTPIEERTKPAVKADSDEGSSTYSDAIDVLMQDEEVHLAGITEVELQVLAKKIKAANKRAMKERGLV